MYTACLAARQPLPSRCFLEKGPSGQKWLFPAGSCRLKLTPGSVKACGKGLLSVRQVDIGALLLGNKFWRGWGVLWVPKATPYLPMSSLVPHGSSVILTFSAGPSVLLFSFPVGWKSIWGPID